MNMKVDADIVAADTADTATLQVWIYFILWTTGSNISTALYFWKPATSGSGTSPIFICSTRRKCRCVPLDSDRNKARKRCTHDNRKLYWGWMWIIHRIQDRTGRIFTRKRWFCCRISKGYSRATIDSSRYSDRRAFDCSTRKGGKLSSVWKPRNVVRIERGRCYSKLERHRGDFYSGSCSDCGQYPDRWSGEFEVRSGFLYRCVCSMSEFDCNLESSYSRATSSHTFRKRD